MPLIFPVFLLLDPTSRWRVFFLSPSAKRNYISLPFLPSSAQIFRSFRRRLFSIPEAAVCGMYLSHSGDPLSLPPSRVACFPHRVTGKLLRLCMFPTSDPTVAASLSSLSPSSFPTFFHRVVDDLGISSSLSLKLASLAGRLPVFRFPSFFCRHYLLPSGCFFFFNSEFGGIGVPLLYFSCSFSSKLSVSPIPASTALAVLARRGISFLLSPRPPPFQLISCERPVSALLRLILLQPMR